MIITGRKIDKIIKDAMLMYQAEAVKEFASYPDTPVEFSQEYKQNMQNMLAGYRGKIVRTDRRKRIAKLAVAIGLAFMMLTAFAARERIIEFFIKIFEDRTQLSTETGDYDEITTVYAPNFLPIGYVSESKLNSKNSYMEVWANQSLKIRYTQRCSNNNDILTDDEHGNYLETIIDGIKIYYFEKNDRKVVVWNFEGYNFKLNCPSDLDWETITQIIKSIEPVN